MKKVVLLIALIGFTFKIQAQQFSETDSTLETTKVIVAPGLKLSKELRVAENFEPANATIGILNNSGFGINLHKTNGIGFTFGGVHKFICKPNGDVSATALILSNELLVPSTFYPTDPSIGTLKNSGYGINIDTTQGIGFTFGGVHKFICKPNGDVSTTALILSNELLVPNAFSPTDPSIGTNDNSGYGINIDKANGIGFAFNGDHKMVFKANGNVAFDGNLQSKGLKVTATPTADFVFENNYDLPSLDFVENHVKAKKHLPEIASAKEMERNGVDVADFQIKLLQKIEELTLYMIDINKRVKELEVENKALKTQIENH